MIRLLFLTLTLALAPMTAAADSQIRSQVEDRLPFYVAGVDVDTLDTAQVASIYHIMHSDRTHGDKVGLIRSAIGGSRFSLRGLLFGG